MQATGEQCWNSSIAAQFFSTAVLQSCHACQQYRQLMPFGTSFSFLFPLCFGFEKSTMHKSASKASSNDSPLPLAILGSSAGFSAALTPMQWAAVPLVQ